LAFQLLQNLLTHPSFQRRCAVQNPFFEILQPLFRFVERVILLSQNLVKYGDNLFFQTKGIKPVKLGDLTSQNLAELVDIKVSFGKLTNAVNYGGSPRDGERSETISLVEVGVHVLLHGLSGQFVLHALHIILGLLLVHIENQILKLAQG